MPIEFACESCNKLLRVPDGSGGLSCECPSCRSLLEIPDPDAIKVVHAASGEQPSSDRLQLPCPKCRHLLNCSPALLGTKGQCKNCHYIFTISTENEGAAPAQSDADSSDWIFRCPKCEQLFAGKPEMRGRKGKCHACGEVFAIELQPADKLQLPTIQRTAAQPRPASTSPPPDRKSAATAPRSPAAIQLVCSSCQGVMEVPSTAAGQTTACPFCQQLLRIPAVGDARTKRRQSTARHASGKEGSTARRRGLNAPSTSSAPSQVRQEFEADATAPDFLAPIYPSHSTNHLALPTKTSSRLPSGRERNTYVLPGIMLIVAAALQVIIFALTMLFSTPSATPPNSVEASSVPAYLIAVAIIAVIMILLSSMQIAGGIAMLRQRKLVLARIGAVICCLPCPSCFFLNIPIGIWNLVVCLNSAARRDFRG